MNVGLRVIHLGNYQCTAESQLIAGLINIQSTALLNEKQP